jgi:SAM-dependent methyltransferase
MPAAISSGDDMESDAYHLMASHEAVHWWFVGRRAVINGVLDGIDLPSDARVLEAGCGTGGNLYHLKLRGEVSAFEPHPDGIELARARHPDLTIKNGSLPDFLPFPAASFDLVAALDVLEHIEDDESALRALLRLVKPGGYVFITVPTHPFLWGSHDRRLHHIRRYSVGELRTMCTVPDADLVYFGAFNTLLAPLAFAIRLAEKAFSIKVGNQERMPSPLMNSLLARIFGFEGVLVRRVRLPFGLSHAVVLRRRE